MMPASMTCAKAEVSRGQLAFPGMPHMISMRRVRLCLRVCVDRLVSTASMSIGVLRAGRSLCSHGGSFPSSRARRPRRPCRGITRSWGFPLSVSAAPMRTPCSSTPGPGSRRSWRISRRGGVHRPGPNVLLVAHLDPLMAFRARTSPPSSLFPPLRVSMFALESVGTAGRGNSGSLAGSSSPAM